MKKLLLTTAALLLCSGSAQAQDYLNGRFGFGVNWQGFQAKYGVAEDWLGEVKVQFASNNTLVGLRAYRLFASVPRMLMVVMPYVGAEADWVVSDYLLGGVMTGAFAGLEMMPAEYLGVELDAGLYYQNFWSGLGNISDLGLVFNVGVTFFF